MLRPQQNYVYVLSHYLNSLVRRIVLVLCLNTLLLAVGTTYCIFVFLLYLYVHTSSIIWVSQFVKEVRRSEGRRRQKRWKKPFQPSMLHQTAHMSPLTQIAPSDCRIHVAFKVSKVDSASAPGLRARCARDRLPPRQPPCAPPPRGR